MSLKAEIERIHQALSKESIDHALIGGFALAVHGSSRATGDIDLLINEDQKKTCVSTLNKINYNVVLETEEVLHFKGNASLDILLARRPLSKKILTRAKTTPLLSIKCVEPEDLIGLKIQAYCNNRKREFQDKADIQFLFSKFPNLNLKQVQEYADLFNEWEEIKKIKDKLK